MLLLRPATAALLLTVFGFTRGAPVLNARALDAFGARPKIDDVMWRVDALPSNPEVRILESGAGWVAVRVVRPRGCRLFLCL
ncbi:hypothetical protein B0H11DRAFT_2223063 [Mycena galericulata]|nr:hypothetical protein B0H11DRAFT_2223063 [Mycena galericulata]